MSRGKREAQRQNAREMQQLEGPTGGLRVLFLGDTAGTGFGTVTRDLAVAMVRRGMDVRILSMNEDAGFAIDPAWPDMLKPRTVILGVPDGWVGLKRDGGAAAFEVLRKAVGIFTGDTIPGWTPQAVLVTGDPTSLEGSPWHDFLPKDLPAYNYSPIEGVGLPPLWKEMWKRFPPIAMTEFGATEIEKILHERPPVVYHGIDPESFWPVSAQRPLVMRGMSKRGITTTVLRSKADCRAYLQWPPNATILFRADRHMPRKTYPAMFRAVAPVLARHPECLMVIHCKTIDRGGSLWHEKSKYPPLIQERIAFTGYHDRIGGVPRPLLTAMYNAADLYVSTSAEGFGLTVAESLACGTPAIALGYSSLPEVVGPAGVLVDKYALIDNIYSYFWAMPKGEAYTEALERLVSDKVELARLGRLGPSQVARFDWDIAAERMEAILSGSRPAETAEPSPARRMQALGLVEARA